MAFLTRAMIAAILKSVSEEKSVKMEKGWKKIKIFFSVIKEAQDLEAFTEYIQKPSDLQAVYIKFLEWMSAVNNLGHFKV